MDLVDILRRESSSEHVAFTEFVLKLKRKTKILFCFFEGKDDNKYYGVRIKNITQREYEHINCGGKESVVKVCELISKKPEYKDVNTSYFVDSDYQPALVINNIYCLPSYSIENQYVKQSVLKRILKNEFSLDEESKDFKTVINLYSALLAKFHEDTIFLNAWLACQSDKRIPSKTESYLRIDSTIGSYFKKLVNTDLCTITNLNDLKDLDTLTALFPNAHIITEDEINTKIEFFRSQDQVTIFRGKFELAFFISFLIRIKSEICNKSSELFESRHKCSLRFEYSTSLTSLSIYAETPNSLFKYLESFKTVA